LHNLSGPLQRQGTRSDGLIFAAKVTDMSRDSLQARLTRRKTLTQIDQELGNESSQSLVRSLTLFDLTCFGIAAVIGAGAFTTIGKASFDGGPAISLLFVITAVACLFSALCYAQFASSIPISGSAYTYAFVAFGELTAWMIGWNLLMEYAIGNSVLAFAWSSYFVNLLEGMQTWLSSLGLKFQIPQWLVQDYYSCSSAPEQVAAIRAAGGPVNEELQRHLMAWESAPNLGGLKLIVDLPAILINLLITTLVIVGIQESKRVSNAMVGLKMAVVVMVVMVGLFYIKPGNWSPFAPNGLEGVFKGIAGVFFAYIGFDAISTTAEECKNAQRDIPRATLLTLLICTVIYIILSFTLTGMVSYQSLNVDDPLAFVFDKVGLPSLVGIISLSAVIATTSVFLVFQLGQPRIFMSMARDGLLPKRFAAIHPRFKTPAFSTIITGLMVALPTLLLNSQFVTDLASIGTLFAFMLVCAGILVSDSTTSRPSGFRVPYLPGHWILPICFLLYCGLLPNLPQNHQIFGDLNSDGAFHFDRIPYAIFLAVFLGLSSATIRYRWSAIPVLGVVVNLYLIAGLGAENWIRFGIWCLIGLLIYAFYGYHNSRYRHG
jgi:APA family basic amino acid/polyamine antiporter